MLTKLANIKQLLLLQYLLSGNHLYQAAAEVALCATVQISTELLALLSY